MATAQVHRFRDSVAAYLGNGDTTYLTPKEARKLARALNGAARSCEREGFAASTFATVTLKLGEPPARPSRMFKRGEADARAARAFDPPPLEQVADRADYLAGWERARG
jgi:hypothetical protein